MLDIDFAAVADLELQERQFAFTAVLQRSDWSLLGGLWAVSKTQMIKTLKKYFTLGKKSKQMCEF